MTTETELPKNRPANMPPTDKLAVREAIHAKGAAGRVARAAMYRTYLPHILRSLRRKGLDAERARDQAQEFFARLFDPAHHLGRSFARVEVGSGSFGGWLNIVSWHAWLNRWRHDRTDAIGDGARCDDVEHHRAPAPELEPCFGESLHDECAKVLIVRSAYEKLRNEYSTIHEVGFVDDLYDYLTGGGHSLTVTYFRAAFGITENAVHQRRRRMKGRLKELLVNEANLYFASSESIEDELRRLALLE